MARAPNLILLGYGVSDTLQLTVEAQRELARAGKAYALGLPPNLRRYLRSLRVECVDLSERFAEGRPYGDTYLDIAEFVLRRTAVERPVLVMTQGNPLFLNALNRFFVMQARERGLSLEVYPGVSTLDALVCDLALDVGTFGLQLFDARRLLARNQRVNPHVPLLVLQLAGFASDCVRADAAREPADYAPFAGYLSQFYPQGHGATLINPASGARGIIRATVPLSRFVELVPHIRASSSLYVDAVTPA